jgi:hypothetical protein
VKSKPVMDGGYVTGDFNNFRKELRKKYFLSRCMTISGPSNSSYDSAKPKTGSHPSLSTPEIF